MVWTSKRPVTPVIAARQKHLLLQLDVVATIKSMLGDDLFWKSVEFLDCLDSGDFIQLDYDYFANVLVDLLTETESQKLRDIIEEFIPQCEFSLLSKELLLAITDSELQTLIQKISPSVKQRKSLEQRIILDCGFQFDKLLLFNAISDMFRGRVMNYLFKGDGTDIQKEIEKFLEGHGLVIRTKEQRTQDQIVHCIKRKSLKQSNGIKQQIEFVLWEAFLVNYRLLSQRNDRETLESLMDRENITYEAVELQIQKKMKHNKKKRHSSEPIFVGWRLDTNTEESINGKKRKSKAEVINLGVTYGVYDAPNFLTKKFVQSCLKWFAQE